MRKPRIVFVVIVIAAMIVLSAYVYRARTRLMVTAIDLPAVSIDPSADVRSPYRIFFRFNGLDSRYGQLAYFESDGEQELQFVQQLPCEVVHAAAGRGVCLTADRGVFTTYAARFFETGTFQSLANIPLAGIPSRARMSRDGTLAAATVFVTGHSYTSLDFSTQTLLIDAASGTVLTDVEQFAVTRNGRAFSSRDFNFWGVTFTPDSKHFYATLSTNRQHFLVKGDIAARSATVIHENVECPSLSPDALRVAYKKRFNVGGRIVWQLHVLDLETREETSLTEKRSIDDQLEWLDEQTVLYTVPQETAGEGIQTAASTSIWRAAADGSSAPVLFLKNAYSPAVVRGEPGRRYGLNTTSTQ